MSTYYLNALDELESEAIYILREVYAQFKSPVILFSGGKDSIVVTQLARKAFYPAKIPFSLLHIDTGHNFQETISFRDEFVKEMNADLLVGSVQDAIDRGIVKEEEGVNSNRNAIQIETLSEVISSRKIDCAIGGARRDEEKSRAKERFFSHRDVRGQWNPRNQRPELWNLFNSKHKQGEHFRVFPISNWTELDIWEYILREKIALPSLYFAHNRKVIQRNNAWIPYSPFIALQENEKVEVKRVRFRTLGDITITGGIESEAESVSEIIDELIKGIDSERGNRYDDQQSDTAMEDRKKRGYF